MVVLRSVESFVFDDDVLSVFENVVTIREAVQAVGYNRTHVWLLCDMGRVVARRSGSTWLVYLPSLVQYAYSKSLS